MEYNQQNYIPGRQKLDGGIAALMAKPYLMQLAGFRAKISLCIDKRDFIIKTAESEYDLEQALRLRHEVFIVELLGRKRLFGIDIDRYDQMCDHLMVIDKLSGACVGTYRVNSNIYSNQFYSESEFHVGKLYGMEGNKLEIGRACIKQEYRKSNMMGLLWEGIYAYMNAIKARYVFGCSSIMTTEPLEIALVHRYLSNSGFYRNDLEIRPRNKYRVKILEGHMKVIDLLGEDTIEAAARKLVPKLINDYFTFGARVCGEPAVDKKFKCADVFTILDLENLNTAYRDERFVK